LMRRRMLHPVPSHFKVSRRPQLGFAGAFFQAGEASGGDSTSGSVGWDDAPKSKRQGLTS
jgi:hypothetical protein